MATYTMTCHVWAAMTTVRVYVGCSDVRDVGGVGPPYIIIRRPVSNMAMVKKTVTSGMAWRPVSHRVSPKGVFDLFKASSFS